MRRVSLPVLILVSTLSCSASQQGPGGSSTTPASPVSQEVETAPPGLPVTEPVSKDTPCPDVAPVCPASTWDDFETLDTTWAAADWATATSTTSGAPAQVSTGVSGATDGVHSMMVPIRMTGAGYEQGYVGRNIQESLAGCARITVDLTLPDDAPMGLRAKAILHLNGIWREPETPTPLLPGQTVTVDVPLSGAFTAPSERDDYKNLTAIGIKIEANDVAYQGPLFVDQLRVAPDWPKQHSKVRSVGTFGGFMRGSTADVPLRNGFLTFVADQYPGRHSLVWPKVGPAGADFVLLQTRFGNAPSTGALRFVDWGTLQADTTVTDSGSHTMRATMSRVFPAVRYTTSASHMSLVTAHNGRGRMRGITIVRDGVIQTIDLNSVSTIDTSRMNEPWMIMFAGGASGWSFDAPLLVTFETKPNELTVTSEGLNVAFASHARSVQVMPLHGLKRFPVNPGWLSGLPGASIVLARALVSKLAAFPVALSETATNDDGHSNIQVRVTHQPIADAWGTVPEPVTPLPPLVAQAQDAGYPVTVDETTFTLDVPTFYGPLRYAVGTSLTYHLPLPAALSRVELPIRVENDTLANTIHDEMLRVIREQVPEKPAAFYLDGDDRTAAFLCEAYPTLSPGVERDKAKRVATRMIEHGWLDSSLQTLLEPVTSQNYSNAAKYWASTEPFDKEWYTGRQLASLATCSELVDFDLARGVWPKALALYRYNQVFFDWATGSTLSSVFGFTALIDGLYFAWEGMIAVARMAKRLNDDATYEDAAYRSARQQLAVFMLWHHSKWVKSLNYAVGHISNQLVAPEEVETRGAIDGFVEDFGAATLQFQSLWQTANAIAFDVLPQFALYRDFGIAPRLRTLTFDIMPALHPEWQNGNAFHAVDNRFYGASNTAFHLAAQAAMFHADAAPLFAAYLASEGTEASKQWYTMRWHAISGPMLLHLERAAAPNVEVPLNVLMPTGLTYDATTGQLRVEAKAIASGQATWRITDVFGVSRDTTNRVCAGDPVLLAP